MKLICLDIDGTVTRGVGGPTLPGVLEAVQQLRRRHPLRFVTNATSRSHAAIAARLQEDGLLAAHDELVTPATVARQVLTQRQHDSGHLIVDAAARDDFGWFREDAAGPAVLLASEAHDRAVGELQPAFRALLDGAALYTLQRNRYFRKGEELVTDLGPVAAFFEYAAECRAQNLGKPSPLLFDALARQVGLPRSELLMVGDDAEFDASGAEKLGMTGVLVRTGKYRDGDEDRVDPRPSAVLDSVADLAEWLKENSGCSAGGSSYSGGRETP